MRDSSSCTAMHIDFSNFLLYARHNEIPVRGELIVNCMVYRATILCRLYFVNKTTYNPFRTIYRYKYESLYPDSHINKRSCNTLILSI